MADENTGDRQTERMFASVGRAITRWSFVESELCSIFTVCSGSVVAMNRGGLDFGNSSVPMAVFFSLESFRGKLAITDAAVMACCHFPGERSLELKRQWAKLHEKVRKLSHKRNRLAHYTVLPAFEDDDETILPPRLVPPYGSPAYWRETGLGSGKKTLSLTHLSHLEQAFGLMAVKLRNFASDLAHSEELFDIYVRQAADRFRSHSRQDPTRAAKIARALSSLG